VSPTDGAGDTSETGLSDAQRAEIERRRAAQDRFLWRPEEITFIYVPGKGSADGVSSSDHDHSGSDDDGDDGGDGGDGGE
jgi:hypothetical protein